VPIARLRLSACKLLAASLLLSVSICLIAQQPSTHGTVEHVTVHGKLLEGNLLGDSPDRRVTIYLPPSYQADTHRRYPVVYMLHGFTDSDAKWFGEDTKNGVAWINLREIADHDIAAGTAREMILVVPNANNTLSGSFYSSSVTTGDWEDFIAKELVAYIDGQYRTLANRDSRGLAGHSMGGYGAVRIGMKHADVFSSVYALSACCLIFGPQRPGNGPTPAEKIHTLDDLKQADFLTLITLAFASAWSPDARNPPLYLDLPTLNGAPRPDIAAKWTANLPLVFLDQYVPNLRSLHAIAFDAGDKDEFKDIPINLKLLDTALNNYGIAHAFEIYDGNHINNIPLRLEDKVLPFFSRNLSFDVK
jgi:S-formylglutathione hydrolase